MKQPDVLIRDHLQRVLAGRSVVVLCGREDDAAAWQQLLGRARPGRCLTIALDAVARSQDDRMAAGATGHLAWQHDIIAGLDGSGWLAQAADTFDPDRTAALVLPDPLDPPAAGTRSRIGRRPPGWRLLEDKTLVDTVWDLLAVPRAPSIVVDVADIAADLEALGALVDRGAGVVCSSQSAGTPMAGADGVYWWRRGQPPRLTNRQLAGRVRVVDIRWNGDNLVPAHDGEADGTLTLNPSLRGWQLTARLIVDRLPAGGPMGLLAVELFRFCDRNWGTNFGELEPPFGMRSHRTPVARGPTTAAWVAGAWPPV